MTIWLIILCSYVIDYCMWCDHVNLEAYQEEMDYKKRLDSLTQLAELCIEVIKQNDEQYADVSFYYILRHCSVCRDYFTYNVFWTVAVELR